MWGNVGSALLVFLVVPFYSSISQSDVIRKGRQANVEQIEGDEDLVDWALWDPVGMARSCTRYFLAAMPKPCGDAFLFLAPNMRHRLRPKISNVRELR